MKHLASFAAALVCFAVATFLLIENVKALAAAHLLLGIIVAAYLLALTLAFPTQMSAARAQLVAWWQAYKGTSGPPPGGMGVVG